MRGAPGTASGGPSTGCCWRRGGEPVIVAGAGRLGSAVAAQFLVRCGAISHDGVLRLVRCRARSHAASFELWSESVAMGADRRAPSALSAASRDFRPSATGSATECLGASRRWSPAARDSLPAGPVLLPVALGVVLI